MAENKKSKQKKSTTSEITGGGSSLWIGAVIIICIGLFIWILRATGATNAVIPDDLLIKNTIRNQFDGALERDKEKYMSSFSVDFKNPKNDYSKLESNIQALIDAEFEVFDFRIEFLPTGDDEEIFHFDDDRGYATSFVYTFWKQRKPGDIGKDTVEKLGAFLLRKEGDEWKIISDESMTLKKKDDISILMPTPGFQPYTDVTTFDWPLKPSPPRVKPPTKKEVTEEIAGESEGGEDNGSD